MKTTRSLKTLSRILLFFGVFFITVFFSDWFWGPFYFNRNYRVLKYILCVAVPVLTVIFNYIQEEKSLKFAGKSTAICMSCFVLSFLIFNAMNIPQFSFSEMSSLFHISYALVCVFSVFLTATIISLLKGHESFGGFYNDFFLGYIPMLALLYFLFYSNYRMGEMSYSVNLVPFKGEIQRVLSSDNELTVLRSCGNIAFYSTVSLTLTRFLNKKAALWSFVFALGLSIITELVQGLFSIGDADIDDIILNGLGALIGALIYKILVESLRRKVICSG